jgi:cobalt/nickel transport system ATP-binding protein
VTTRAHDDGHAHAGDAVLSFDGVGHVYPDDTAALKGVSLEVGRGERVALLGPNGAGKSTLMLHANGILRATEGTVTVNGEALEDDTVDRIRRDVGLVFQDPDDQLFMTTLYDDVAFGPLNMGRDAAEVDRRVHEALHAVDLADVASRPAHHLSYGQRKRAALATVISMDSDILVLDEPTANLDPRARREMVAFIEGLDATIVIATHDMDVAWRLCDRAIVMDDGRLVTDGPAGEVMTDRDLLEAHGLELPHGVG